MHPSVSQSFPDLDGAAQRVDHLDIRVPLPWLDRIHLIDTPGLGQVPVFDAQVQDYLAEADAVVFVVSALQPVAESERTFLRQALRVTNGAPMLFVINRIDQIRNANDAKRLIATISARIRTIHPEAPIFALSAQDELDRCVGVAAPETRAALDDFAGFRSALEQSILRNRDLIQIDRAVHDLSALIDEVRASIAYLRKASSVSTDERVARIAQYTDTHSLLHNHIRDQVARVERELAVLAAETIGWMDGFIARFATEALPMINQSTVSDLTQYYIFFLAESVRDALEACLEAQRPIVQALLTDVRVSTQHAIASGVFNSEISERISTLASEAIFGKRAWNGIDTLQFVVDQSVQRLFGTTHHALIQLFSQQVVQRTGEQAHRAAFREQLANALPRLQQSLQVELHALYDDLTRAATTEIVAAAQQEIDTSLTMLRQAAEQPTGAASVQTVVSDRALAWLNQMTDQVRLVEPQFT